MYAIVQEKHVVFVNHFCKLTKECKRILIGNIISRRPQQARQPGATGGTGGQGNTGAGQRGGNKQAPQPANMPVSKSMFLFFNGKHSCNVRFILFLA